MSATATIQGVLEGRARWCVVQGDCLDILPTLPPKCVDHVITDPPYSAKAMRNARANGETMKQRRDGKVYDFGYEALQDNVRGGCAVQFARVAARWVLVWSDIERAHCWREDMEGAGLRYVREGVWVRLNSAPQFSGDRPAQGVEACVIMHAEGRLRWNGGGRPAVWTHQIVNSQAAEREHSTPKPLPLMLEQVESFADPGDLVLDAFAGSGTTGVACLRLGRRFIGIEKDPKYAALARERLAAEQDGLSLRDVRAGQQPLFPQETTR